MFQAARKFLVCSVVAALSDLPHQKRIVLGLNCSWLLELSVVVLWKCLSKEGSG